MKSIYKYILENFLSSDNISFKNWSLRIDEAEIGGEFANLESYNQNMAKGLADKLFFIDQLPLKQYDNWIFVDFGCADGVLINALSIMLPKYGIKGKLIGFDISDTMINLANEKFKNMSTTELEICFTTRWQEVIDMINDYNEAKKVLVCNSVIHEVYSYADDSSDINWFWKIVNHSGFDYVCVRDMMVSERVEHKTDKKMLDTFYEHVEDSKPELKKYIKEFEEHWGSLEDNKNFLHYLLKYRWTTNWKREVNENYFSVMTEEFLTKMRRFKKIYFEEFRVPFLENCWEEDFGVKLKDTTHIKAIFAK